MSLGETVADVDGNWELVFDENLLSFGDKLSATSTREGRSSEIGKCNFAQVAVGCDERVSEFPYEKNFEDLNLSGFKVLGKNFTVFGSDNCSDNDGNVLFFDARDGSDNEGILYSQAFDLTGAAFAQLEFDVAHSSSFLNRQTFLDISVSGDCGETYTNVYSKGTNTGLRTISSGENPNFDYFPEGCADWRSEIIDLNSFVGSDLIVKLTASIPDVYGQNLFIDNIVMDRGDPCPSENLTSNNLYVDISESLVNLCEGQSSSIPIEFKGLNLSWTIDGRMEPNFNVNTPIGESGIYIAKVSNRFGCSLTDTVEIQVNENPEFAFDEKKEFCRDESLPLTLQSAEGADSFEWYIDGNLIENQNSQFFTPDISGQYISVAKTASGCSLADTIDVTFHELPIYNISDNMLICP